jgi:diguanylate cyclase (GGDEF)-like protein/PAS domain S-box-containing protein
MAEGVLLLDQNERIVLVNSAFAKWVNRAPEDMLGEKASDFDWRAPGTGDAARDFPWRDALRDSKPVTGTPLLLAVEGGIDRSFAVNGSPVLDGWGRAKGVIATFDDVTELERKSNELADALVELEKTQDEIQLQNDELQVLATRDPLTGVANRRSFLEGIERDFVLAKREGRELSCIMVDIDHFKRVNDNHGHAVGDEVIRRVSEALTGTVRSTDAVCRYGGEEFCIALPDAAPEAACMVAERIRKRIESPGFSRVPVTASLGVASIQFGATKPNALINQADQALYASKGGGRNRVTRWDEMEQARDSSPTGKSPPSSPSIE